MKTNNLLNDYFQIQKFVENNLFIEKVKILSNTYPGSQVLKINSEYELESINLLVGQQGCGKLIEFKKVIKNINGLLGYQLFIIQLFMK